MMGRRAGPAALLLWLLAAGAGALDREEIIWKWDVRLWGGDVAVGYRGWALFPGVDTILWLSAGGGWHSLNHFAAEDDAADAAGTRFRAAAVDWRAGLSQGIIAHPDEDRNLLEAVLLYRGKRLWHLDTADLPSALPDREGLLQNSLLLALVLDDVAEDPRAFTRDGLYGSLSAEWVPDFFHNNAVGNSDYARFTGIFCGFHTLVSTDTVSLYLAERLLYDHLVGADGSIPISALSSFGGLSSVPISSNLFRGLGGAVRGISNERFDGRIKMANNLDLRLHFPGWKILDRFTPGLVAYLDAGAYDRGTGRLSLDPVFASVGAGVLVNALSFDFIGYIDYFINEGDFSLSLGLGAHF